MYPGSPLKFQGQPGMQVCRKSFSLKFYHSETQLSTTSFKTKRK